MNNKVIIVGAFHEVIELAEDNGFRIIGLIDNEKAGFYRKYKILCKDNKAEKLAKSFRELPLIITPDIPILRQKLHLYYSEMQFEFASLISKDCKISKSASIDFGTIIQSGVNVSAECNIGKFVKLNTNCNIMHNSNIGDFATVAPNAVILGNVKIGNCCYIGSNATILPNIEICDNSIIGAGAVVTKDVPSFSIVAGNPAKILKQFNTAEETQSYFHSKQRSK